MGCCLYKWEKCYQVNPTSEALERSDVEQLKADVRRLQRENGILRQEREILKNSVHLLAGALRMWYEAIEAIRGEFEVRQMCEVIGVKRSGYYARWRA